MNCTETRSRLHPYLDRQLDLESALAVEGHLASCPDCRAIVARQSTLRAALREHAHYYGAPPGLAERIRGQIGRRSAIARPGWRWPPLRQWLPAGAAVAAAAIVSWTAAIQYAAVSTDERIAEQVVAGHARAVLSEHRVDVASSDRHTVKPWLSSKLDFSPPVVDLAGAGFPLDGGRLDYLNGRPVATLCYRHRQHTIDLFVWPEQDARGESGTRSLARQGYNVLRWSDGGMAFWAISDVGEADLKTFAEAYASAK